MASQEPILIKKLTQVFKTKANSNFVAVNNLNFGVKPSECFGLLGLNGAGKTTTIQILTGQSEATDGTTYLNGKNIKKERNRAIRSLGYCPQFDMLPDYLTSRESLALYANLRGLKSDVKNQTIDEFISAFKLDEFKNKLVQNLR